MYTGWITRYKLNRPLDHVEKESHLERTQPGPLLPHDNGLLQFNSTFIEWIDRRYGLRGALGGIGVMFFLAAVVVALMLPVGSYLDGWYVGERNFDMEDASAFAFAFLLGSAGAYLMWRLCISRDFFTYTYYPIRFNRKTGLIHVFRHNGPDGVLTVPWRDAYFFIGRSKGDIYDGGDVPLDLRCHVLDEKQIVRDTFAVGHYNRSPAPILETWELIRRYMEEGPQSLPRFNIVETGHVSLKDCFVRAFALFSDSYIGAVLFFPIWGPWTLAMYAVLKSSKAPVWPAEIEASCVIEPGDPYERPMPNARGDIKITPEEMEQDLAYQKKVLDAREKFERQRKGQL